MHPLDGPRAKLKRSKQHLAALNRQMEGFWTKHPIRVTQKEEDTGRGRMMVLRVHDLPEHVDPRLALIVGDAMHNARSALDHLVHALIDHHQDSGVPQEKRREFPVWNTPPGEDGAGSEATLKKKLAGMHPLDEQSILDMQPYTDPGTERSRVLRYLDELDNVDKHRLLLGRYIAPQPPDGQYHPQVKWSAKPFKPPLEYLFNPNTITDDGDWVFMVPLPKDNQILLEGVLRLGLSFGDSVDPEDPFYRIGVPRQDLEVIRGVASGIVEDFAPSFDRPPGKK